MAFEKQDITYKIALVVCWYGPLPWYFNFFIHSAKYNTTVDFFIITDEPITIELPFNIKIVYKKLAEIRLLAQQKMGFEVSIPEPYKLCDFKPAYGLLFEDYLTGYHFWGHIDMDIIFGDIRYFITDDILYKHDLIAVRHDFLTGYFTLFKNNESINRLFEQSKDYKKVFTTSKHFCFDETNFKFQEFKNNFHYTQIKSEIESMTHVVKRLHEKKMINAYFEFHVIEGAEGKLKWEKGKIFYKNQYEAILYHLIVFKTKFKNKEAYLGSIPDVFSIGKDDILFKKQKSLKSE